MATNSIVQGEQVARLWPLLFDKGHRITFAHTSFKWANLAAHNAGVTVVIVGLAQAKCSPILFESMGQSSPLRRQVDNISPYLVPHDNTIVEAANKLTSNLSPIMNGNKPADGGNLLMRTAEARSLCDDDPRARPYVRRFVGAKDSISGNPRYCLWISDEMKQNAEQITSIAERFRLVADMRTKSPKPLTKRGAATPHAFQQIRQTGKEVAIVVPRHSSERREYLPVSLYPPGTIIADGAFALYDAPLWNLAFLVSQLHLVWIAAVCGKIKTDYRYSSTLGWNTFPVPKLTQKNLDDLNIAAERILLAREIHFPASLEDLYDPTAMPADLRQAHEQNDEILERIYIGRKFKNDTERLERLFGLYTKSKQPGVVSKETQA